MMCRGFLLALVLLAGGTAAASGANAQTPQPFPRLGTPSRPQPPPPPDDAPPPKVLPPSAQPPAVQGAAGEPTEGTLGMPIYPGAQFLTSFDAGRGQRYFLFGTNVDFAQIVAYYRTALKQRGTLVYDQPPIHMFDVGRFREDSMAFPPGITVKDYTWGGSEGYLDLKPGAPPTRYRTVIQLVPAPEGAGSGR